MGKWMIRPYFESIIFVIASLLLLTTITGCITDLDPRMFKSSYEYDIEIRSDSPLSNVTFIIPLPVKNNTPMLGQKTLTEEDFTRENITIEFSKAPPGLNVTGTVSQEGYDPWFVIIRSDEMNPSKPGNYVYRMEKNVDLFLDSPVFPVNTLYPIGNESLISPKFDLIWVNPEIVEIRQANIVYKSRYISQKTPIYLQYSASPKTKVDVMFTITGTNSWKQEYDASVGNYYRDFSSGIFNGEQDNWILINGNVGSLTNTIYPNFNNPEWQKALNKTTKPEKRSGMEIYDFIFSFFSNSGN
jgi:hypothetical protein